MKRKNIFFIVVSLYCLSVTAQQNYHPSWSPAGDRIAFVSGEYGAGDIYTIKTDGTELLRLTNNEVGESHPNWSPDGKQLVFASQRSGNWDVYVMSKDGQNIQSLTSHPEMDMGPVWSPKGDRILFASKREGSMNMYEIKIDGTGLRKLTSGEGNHGSDGFITFSPDGRKVVFNSDRSGADELYVLNENGVTQKMTSFDFSIWKPSWSPKTNQIIVEAIADRTFNLILLDSDKMEMVKLTDSPSVDRYPTWSPDGKQIAFFSNRGGNADVYTLDIETKEINQLTFGKEIIRR